MVKKRKARRPAPAKPTPRRQQPVWDQWVQKHPTSAAAVLFALLTVIFFGVIRPALFSPGMMIYGTDTMGAGVFFRGFYADFWRQYHAMPLWEPYIHGGMPFVDAMHGDIFYPAAILQIIFPVAYALGLKLILHVFLAGLFMYLFLRDWGLDWRPSVFGGILYMFTPCLISLMYPGHDGKMYVIALTPIAFLFLRRGAVDRRWSSFFAFGLAYAFLILTAHVQMAYYASWGLGLYFVFLLWDAHRFNLRKITRPVVAFVLAVVLAAGASAIQWMAPYFYLQKHSQRIQHTEEKGFAWSSSWSMHPEEAASLLVPEFPGDNLTHKEQSYWGQNYFKLNSEAVGLFALFFMLITLTVFRRREIFFFAALSLVALIYALGANTPLFTVMYHLVPGVKKFRAPSMINFLFAFGLVAIAAWGLHQIGQLPAKAPALKKYFKSAAIIAGIYTLIALVISVWGEGFFTAWAGVFQSGTDAQKLQAIRANTPRVVAGLWISTILLWAALGLLWARFNRALKGGLLFGGLAVLALIDLWRFDARFIHVVDPDNYYRRSPIVDFLEQVEKTQGPFRTFLLPRSVPDNYLAMYGLEEVSLSAMHGNHLLSYDNFTGRHENPQNLINPKFLDLLNVTRVISGIPAQTMAEEVRKTGNRPLLEFAQTLSKWPVQPERIAGLFIYTNPGAIPRVAGFFGYRVIDDHEAVLAEIKKTDFPHRRLLLLEQEILDFAPVDNAGSLPEFQPGRVIENNINDFTVEIDMPADGLIFLSENYYPAWHAEEAGRPLTIYRTNYTFRAVFVEAGKHTIHFWFENPHFNKSKLLSGVSMILLFVGLLATGWRRRKVSGVNRRSTPDHDVNTKPPVS